MILPCSDGAGGPGGPRLVEETAAFLGGDVLAVYRSLGSPIPDWAWINRLAHGPAQAILGGRRSFHRHGSWPWAADLLGAELAGAAHGDAEVVRRLQQDLVVPIELALMHPGRQQLRPEVLVLLCLNHLRAHPAVRTAP